MLNSSNLTEVVLAVIGVIGVTVSFIFFLANLTIRADIDKSVIRIAEKQQAQYDFIKVKMGLLLVRVKDIENFLSKEGEFYKRTEMSEDDLPSDRSDFR